jgi:hypothetical protein
VDFFSAENEGNQAAKTHHAGFQMLGKSAQEALPVGFPPQGKGREPVEV